MEWFALLRQSAIYKKLAPYFIKAAVSVAVLLGVAAAAFYYGQEQGFVVGNREGIASSTKLVNEQWTKKLKAVEERYSAEVSMWNARAYENYSQYLEEKKQRAKSEAFLNSEIDRLRVKINTPVDIAGQPLKCEGNAEIYLGPDFISVWNLQNQIK